MVCLDERVHTGVAVSAAAAADDDDDDDDGDDDVRPSLENATMSGGDVRA